MNHKRSWLNGFLLVFTAALLVNCQNDDLPDVFLLEDFRILALINDPPESNPGDTVTITAFLSDVSGEGRPIAMRVEGCLDPGVDFGAIPTCENSDTRVVIEENAQVSGLTEDQAYTGAADPQVSVQIPSSEIIFAQQSETDQFNGVPYLVTFTFSLPDGAQSQGFTQIRVTSRTNKNNNPTYDANPILSNGQPITSVPSKEIELNANIADGSQETYEWIRGNETITETETIETAWYISDGELNTSITDNEESLKWTPPEEIPQDRPVIITIITRDGRGGTAAHIQAIE